APQDRDEAPVRWVRAGERDALATAEVLSPHLSVPDADDLEAQLAFVARLIRAGIGTRVYHVTHPGDFDLHSNLAAGQTELLGAVDRAITGFFARLGREAARVMVMTWSEFGRRPAANGSGTDHGTASVQLVIGPAVRGGHYGEPPSLTNLD